jgi:hypothetical protein
MTKREPGFLDKLMGFVPGYRGYAERDARRTADGKLRAHVATRLDAAKRHVHDAITARSREGRMDGLDALDRLGRRLGTCANTIRHAEHGGSGLMDDVVVKAEDLDRVYQEDLALHDQAEQLGNDLERLRDGKDESVEALLDQATALLSAIERRDEIFEEVFPCRS